jgi:CHAD domain-containing protein
MPFRFKEDESVAKGVRRMAREQLRKARAGLTDPTPKREEAVHDARKRLKKVRALLRLVRPRLGEKLYRQENTRIRDTARPLSEVRDARVLGEALDKLGRHFGDEVPAQVLARARAALEQRRQDVTRRVLDEQDALGKTAASLGEALPRVKGWSVAGGGWSALADGLKRSYRQGYEAFAAARAEPTVANLHEWRKRAKDLRHQLEVLQPIRPAVIEGWADRAHELGDLLGDDHDLAVLRDVLGAITREGGDGAWGELMPLIERRRGELRQEAYRLGEQVYRERPRDFLRRLKAYWRAWRSEAKAAQFG